MFNLSDESDINPNQEQQHREDRELFLFNDNNHHHHHDHRHQPKYSFFLSSPIGCQVLIDHVVPYCNSLDVIRLGSTCSSIYHSFNNNNNNTVWKTLLATEWCIDVHSLEQLHLSSLQRTSKFIRAKVNELVPGEDDDDADQEEEEEQEQDLESVLPTSSSTPSTPERQIINNNNRYMSTTMMLSSPPAPPTVMRRRMTSERGDDVDHKHQDDQYHEASSSSAASPVAHANTTPVKGQSDTVDNTPNNNNNNQNNNNNNLILKSPIRQKSLLKAPPPYDWKGLLQRIHKYRVTNWLLHLNSIRDPPTSPPSSSSETSKSTTVESLFIWINSVKDTLFNKNNKNNNHKNNTPDIMISLREAIETKIQHLDCCIEAQLQSGTLRGQIHHRHRLAEDLHSQGLLFVYLAKLHILMMLTKKVKENQEESVLSMMQRQRSAQLLTTMMMNDNNHQDEEHDKGPTPAQRQLASLAMTMTMSCPIAQLLPLSAFPQREFIGDHDLYDRAMNHPAFAEFVATSTTTDNKVSRPTTTSSSANSGGDWMMNSFSPGSWRTTTAMTPSATTSTTRERNEQQHQHQQPPTTVMMPNRFGNNSNSTSALFSSSSSASVSFSPTPVLNPYRLQAQQPQQQTITTSTTTPEREVRNSVGHHHHTDPYQQHNHHQTITTTSRSRSRSAAYREDMTNDEVLDTFFQDFSSGDDSSSSSSSTTAETLEEQEQHSPITCRPTTTTAESNDRLDDNDDDDDDVTIDDDCNDDIINNHNNFIDIDQQTLLVCPIAKEHLQRALGNFALVQLLEVECCNNDNNNNNNKYSIIKNESHLYAIEITLCLGEGSTRFTTSACSGFDFTEAYDDIQANGSARDRAGFIFRWEFWRGPSFNLKMQQYAVCDLLRFWPERITREAYNCCCSSSSSSSLLLVSEQERAKQLCCRAWMHFDRNQVERGRELITEACSLVPVCRCEESLGPLVRGANRMNEYLFGDSNKNKKKPKSLKQNTFFHECVPSNFSVLLEKQSSYLPIDAERHNFAMVSDRDRANYVASVTQQMEQQQQHSAITSIKIFKEKCGPAFDYSKSDDNNYSTSTSASTNEICCSSCSQPRFIYNSFALGFIHFSAGFILNNHINPQTAIQALTHYLIGLRSTRDPSRRAIVCNNIGTIFLGLKDYACAAAWHDAGVSLNKNYYLSYKNLARCLNALGSAEKAAEVIDRALRYCRPLPSEAFAERAKYTSLANPELVIPIRVNPRYNYPYRLRAALIVDRVRASIRQQQESMMANNNNSAEAVAALTAAFALMSAQETEKSFAELDRVINIRYEPNDISLRAAFARDAGNMMKATESMKLALTLQPDAMSFLKWAEKHGDSSDNLIVEEF